MKIEKALKNLNIEKLGDTISNFSFSFHIDTLDLNISKETKEDLEENKK